MTLQVRLQYELYPAGFEQSGRLVLLVSDVEVRDRLADSHINKLLYQYTTEAMPKQSHASMVSAQTLCCTLELPMMLFDGSVLTVFSGDPQGGLYPVPSAQSAQSGGGVCVPVCVACATQHGPGHCALPV